VTISLYDYLHGVAIKVALAEEKNDVEEVVRLLKLLRDTCSDKILELDPPPREELPEEEAPETPEEEA
jgi:hypothetical protein